MTYDIPEWSGKAVGVNKWLSCRVVHAGRKTFPKMYETTAYREFKMELAMWIRANCKHKFHTASINVKITICIYTLMDSDAIIKPVFDAMEDSGIIDDDKYIQDFQVIRHSHKRGDRDSIKIEIEEV